MCPQNRSRICEVENYILLLPGLESRLSNSSLSPSELFRLLFMTENIWSTTPRKHVGGYQYFGGRCGTCALKMKAVCSPELRRDTEDFSMITNVRGFTKLIAISNRYLQLIRPYLKLRGLSPRANYTDRATAACRRSYCQLLRIEGAT
jgi:hypothetical protein